MGLIEIKYIKIMILKRFCLKYLNFIKLTFKKFWPQMFKIKF